MYFVRILWFFEAEGKSSAAWGLSSYVHLSLIAERCCEPFSSGIAGMCPGWGVVAGRLFICQVTPLVQVPVACPIQAPAPMCPAADLSSEPIYLDSALDPPVKGSAHKSTPWLPSQVQVYLCF